MARGLPRGRWRAGDAWERFVGVAIVSLKFRGLGWDFHLLTVVGNLFFYSVLEVCGDTI